MPDVVISFVSYVWIQCVPQHSSIQKCFWSSLALVVLSLNYIFTFYNFYFLRYISTLRLTHKFTCLLLQDTQTNSNLYSTTLHINATLWKDSKFTKYFNKMHRLSFQVQRIQRIEEIAFGGRKCHRLLRMAVGEVFVFGNVSERRVVDSGQD